MPFRIEPQPKLMRSVRSPVSVSVVKSLARQPRKELKTRKLESCPVDFWLKLIMICGILELNASGIESVKSPWSRDEGTGELGASVTPRSSAGMEMAAKDSKPAFGYRDDSMIKVTMMVF
jgi:hypothetical protein